MWCSFDFVVYRCKNTTTLKKITEKLEKT